MLAYLSRYTHRVAISNRRLIKTEADNVTFRVKDYRREGHERYTTMTLSAHEFIRRFLIHVLPKGLHRIRHYGLFANGNRTDNLARIRALLNVDDHNTGNPSDAESEPQEPDTIAPACPSCGGRMIIIETFEAGCTPRHVHQPVGIDSS